jgi:DNA primase
MDFSELTRELDMEFVLERESLPYRTSRGVNGMQLNLKYCPACGDSRYRAYLNADNGRGNCFVCNETFTKIKFIRHHFQLAADDWRGIAQKGEELLREQGWRPKRMQTAMVEQTNVTLPISEPLPLVDGSNLVYLVNRGITPEITRYFHLRWCEYGWWLFKDEKGEQGSQGFDNRLIIPVYDLDGELVTFQGRDLTGTSDRKYLFPKMLPGTGRFLLNGQNVRLTDEILIGEGAFDVMAQKIALDEEIALRHIVPVGTFGKHLSYGSTDGNDQIGRLLQLKAAGLKKITFMWDGEEKALISALNAAKLTTSIGLLSRVALLPAGKDPNEVLPEQVRVAYYQAQTWTPALDVRWRLQNPYSPRFARKTVSHS